MGAVCNGQRQMGEIPNPQNNGQAEPHQQVIDTVPHSIKESSQIVDGQNVVHQGKEKNTEEEQFQKIEMVSSKKANKINFSSMQVLGAKQRKKRINQFEIEAPYSIVALSVSKELRATINRIGRDIFAKYFEDTIKSGWKLHKNGYYINYLDKKLTAVFTEHSYFEGELYDETDKILPKSKGILITENGRYEGHFQKGKAHGRGTFEDYKKNAFYNGVWENGKMVEGVIQCPQYKYKGKLKNGLAHGVGELHFKERDIFYMGKFKKGEYYDKNAIYQTPDYVYEGYFVNGHKNGEGTLVQKERNYNKDKKMKYRPPTHYQGEFYNDIFLNKQKQPEKEDPKTSQPAEEANKKVDPLIPQPQQFQQEVQQFEGIDDQNNNANQMLQDEYESLKPKFIWVEPPRPVKVKKVKIDPDQF